MANPMIRSGALVLFKSKPARVVSVGDKFEIDLPGGASKKVRDKDIQLLHPGPVSQLPGEALSGEPAEAWEMLEGEQTNLEDLAELVFGEFTPQTAWSTWVLLTDGVYFEGDMDAIQPRSEAQVRETIETRDAKAKAEAEWEGFLDRMRSGELLEEDDKQLNEVERLALGDSDKSRILDALGWTESPAGAHQTLLKLGRWSETDNPHPRRRNVSLLDPEMPVPTLPDEDRRDLTYLDSYAIDDEGSTDPDDAIAIDGDTLWVHVADVSALVEPDSGLDMEARGRASNLYLPEGTVHMLPPAVTEQLALGLAEESPALSFGIKIDEQGEVSHSEVCISRVKVKRISYADADAQLSEPPFAGIKAFLDRFRTKRRNRGSAKIQLPEVSVRLRDGEVVIRPLPALESREMVADAMLLAGEAAARYSIEHSLAFPFSTQAPPESVQRPETLPEMYAYRRAFKRSQLKSNPEPHCGLGLECYSQVTSPLRRYLDLVCHQQLRAHLKAERGVSGEGLLERVGAAEALIDDLRRSERESNLHWKLVWLLGNPEWQGEAVMVDQRGKRGIFIIPDLAMETGMQAGNHKLGDVVTVRCKSVDLPGLVAHFGMV